MSNPVSPCLLKTPSKGVRVTMSIGTSCPFTCAHCYQDKNVKQEQDATRNIKAIEQMVAANVTKLYWDGSEPMTNRDIERYLARIEELRASDPELFNIVSIATNGALVNSERAARLYECGLRNIMVSLDGATLAVNDEFRMPGSYDAALKAVNILNNAGLRVRIGTTLWRKNVEQIDDLIALADTLGIYEVSFNWMQPTGSAVKHPELFPDPHTYQAIAAKINAYKESGPVRVNLHRAGVSDGTSVCPAAQSVAYVSQGKVWPCSWIRVVAPQYESQQSLDDRTLDEVLATDARLYEFRRLVEQPHMAGKCPAVAYMHTGSLEGLDPIQPGGVFTTNQTP